jgi:hypothetical protein
VADPKTLQVLQIVIANYCDFEVLVELYCSAKALWPCFQSITTKIYNAECWHVVPIQTAAKWEIYFKCYRRPLLTKRIAHKCLLYQMFHRMIACNHVDLALELSLNSAFRPKHFVRGILLSGRIETFVKLAESFNEADRKKFVEVVLHRFWSVTPVFANSLYHKMVGKYGIQRTPLPSNSCLILYLKDAAELKSAVAVHQVAETLDQIVSSPVVFGQSFKIRFRQQVIAQRSPQHVVAVRTVIQALEQWDNPYSQSLIGKLLIALTVPPTLMAV